LEVLHASSRETICRQSPSAAAVSFLARASGTVRLLELLDRTDEVAADDASARKRR